MLPCYRSASSLQYAEKDSSTARCRLSQELFRKYRANVGWIVHFEVDLTSDFEISSEKNLNFEVICTAWPALTDTPSDELCVFIDDSVTKGSINPAWCSGMCRIVKVCPAIPCHTVRCLLAASTKGKNQNELTTSVFGGFPVKDGFQLSPTGSFKYSSMINTFTATHFPYGQYGIIDVMTVLVPVADKVARVSDSNRPRASCTGVVHTVIRSCIFPSVLLPSQQLYNSGVLLSGPPGVGKTYAITAVKEICKEVCNISIHNLCIPDILADPDPISYVEDILDSLNALPPDHGIKNTFSSRKGEKNTPSFVKNRTPQKGLSLGASHSSPSASSSSSPASKGNFSWLTPSPQKNCAKPFSPLSNQSTPSGAMAHLQSTKLPELHVIMLDEIDALGGISGVNASTAVQHSIKHLICAWMDNLAEAHLRRSAEQPFLPTVVIATSNRPGDVDRCFCRGGRLEREIDITESSSADREHILRELLADALDIILGLQDINGNKNPPCEENNVSPILCSLAKDIASCTGGYVAADLSSLVSAIVRIHQSSEDLPRVDAPSIFTSDSGSSKNIFILRDLVMSAALSAKKQVPPSCLRGATVELPSLNFDDVIGYSDVKKNLSRVLSFASSASSEKLIRFGQQSLLGGVLLHGPPGNSKTRLVQAAAATHGLPVISLSSADVYSAYVGDSEAEIRRVFNLARQSHPCVLFMDEIDALVTNRQEESSGSNVESRVLSTLLNEMDGIGGRGNGVFVFAATNRIDFIDSALLRKGRFHHLLHVPLPTLQEKEQLLIYFAERFGIEGGAVEDIRRNLGNRNLSGADVENMCREAGMNKIRDLVAASVEYTCSP